VIVQATDTLTGGSSLPQDHPTTSVPDTLPESPLPGGLAEAVRWFFHVPQWIQIGGAVLALLVGGWLVYWLWKRRADLWRWIRTRQTAIQVALGIVVAGVILAAGAFARVSWNYTQHSNEFCTACHIMADPFQRFEQSEHADLECHDCHQQPISASMRQVYLWVLERPEEIGPHSPVPDERCASCHIRADPNQTWERIAATAGHRIHLESDSAALDTAMCVTCHGAEVHRFVPVDQTCGQAGCHAEEDTRIVLGEMAGQTGLHCVGCHEFTAPVPEEVPRDTAHRVLVPGDRQCLGCHEMQQVMADFQVDRDPHAGACGMCHDPHVQEEPRAAFASCTEAGCHEAADTLSPFHRGLAHAVVNDCGECHRAHEWTVDGEDCASCHTDIAGARRTATPREGPGTRAPTGPRSGPAGPSDVRGVPPDHPFVGGIRWAEAGAGEDTLPYRESNRPFDHRDHVDVACTECHASGERHGEITVRTARECAACHHDDTRTASRDCTACHSETSLDRSFSVSRAIHLTAWDAPRDRDLAFSHGSHRELGCGECHRSRPLLPGDRSCTDCHADHHRADADCSSCHIRPPEDAHDLEVHRSSCTGAGCHGEAGRAAGSAFQERSRSACLSCHTDQRDHEPDARCADCHLLPSPHPDEGRGP
jgi:hypothetical protein